MALLKTTFTSADQHSMHTHPPTSLKLTCSGTELGLNWPDLALSWDCWLLFEVCSANSSAESKSGTKHGSLLLNGKTTLFTSQRSDWPWCTGWPLSTDWPLCTARRALWSSWTSCAVDAGNRTDSFAALDSSNSWENRGHFWPQTELSAWPRLWKRSASTVVKQRQHRWKHTRMQIEM